MCMYYTSNQNLYVDVNHQRQYLIYTRFIQSVYQSMPSMVDMLCISILHQSCQFHYIILHRSCLDFAPCLTQSIHTYDIVTWCYITIYNASSTFCFKGWYLTHQCLASMLSYNVCHHILSIHGCELLPCLNETWTCNYTMMYPNLYNPCIKVLWQYLIQHVSMSIINYIKHSASSRTKYSMIISFTLHQRYIGLTIIPVI